MISSLAVHIDTAEKIDYKIHPEVKLMHVVFLDLKKLTEKHIAKEERFLFPIVKKIGLAKKKRNFDSADDLLLIDGTLDELKSEHAKIKQQINQLVLLCMTNPLSVDSSPSLKSFYQEFKDLEYLMQKQFFIEDEVLIPKLVKFHNFLSEENIN